eukprot:GHVH01001347.1.p1 GENE.GHVH01001347.1~~GHVH01001347.1.p1  ORF type:complete len:271 (+),score=32.81 GHVH01001347.1:49-861(+)
MATTLPQVVTPLETTLGPKDRGVTIGDSLVEVPKEAIKNAISALRTTITDEDGEVALQRVVISFQLATVPDVPYQRHVLIPVPHSVYSLEDTDLCVIVPDGHKVEYESQPEILDGVDKIIEFSTLFREYQSFESKKDLVNAFDVFLCDRRLSPNVGNFLGRTFRDKGKQPVLIDLGHDGSKISALCQSVDLIKNSVKFQIRTGSLLGITAGRSDQSDKHLVENLAAIIIGINNFFTNDAPDQYKNTIIKCNVAFRDSKALPLFAHKDVYH